MSQFTSTLLLLDVHQTHAASNWNATVLPSDIDFSIIHLDNFDAGAPYWSRTPNIFPTLAEYHEEGDRLDRIHDTGPTFRAFFPLTDQFQRSSLHKYAGAASVLDARVICVKPKLNFSVNFPDSWDGTFLPNSIGLSGTVKADTMPNNLFKRPGEIVGFNCSAPFGVDAFANTTSSFASTPQIDWPLALCILDTPDVYPDGIYDDSYIISVFLIFNASGAVEAWIEASAHQKWIEYTENDRINSEWADFKSIPTPLTRSLSEAKFATSLCFAPVNHALLNISARGGKEHVEASLSANLSTGTYDTANVRFNLGATIPLGSPPDRGYLQMDHLSWKTIADQVNLGGNGLDQYETGLGIYLPSIYFCNSCLGSPQDSIQASAAISKIFYDIVRNTGHPALAIQAALTIICGLQYYTWLPLFTIENSMSFVTYTTVIAPTQWIGLPIVIAMSLVQCALAAMVLIIYARSTKRSIIGSVWSAVAQIAESPVISEWLRTASTVDDGTFAERMKLSGQHQSLIGVDIGDREQIVLQAKKAQ